MEQRNLSDDLAVPGPIESPKPQEDVSGYETLVNMDTSEGSELSVLVSGVHCASCIQKIESSLKKQPDIINARVNFSSGRLTINWNGPAILANDYVGQVEKLGYPVQPYDVKAANTDADQEERFLLLCLGVAGFAMGNVMLLSVGVWTTSTETMGMATRDFLHWVSALIALPTILYAGRPFFRSAFNVLKGGHTNMDVPISLALILASGMSLAETIRHGEHAYFDSALMLMFFLLIGRYLDFRARKTARSTATDLLSSLSGFATVIEGDKQRKVAIRDLQENMTVLVNAGEKIPVDGVVLKGKSSIDGSLVTGETIPQDINKGSDVYAGTMNLDAPLTIQVAKAAENSLLADIVRLMEQAGQGQAKYVRLADKAAKLYTPVVHTFALIAFLGWWLFGGISWQDSLVIAITVLIITCPCALGLAVPVVQVLASSKLMKNGVLVKSGDALERLASIDGVFFDKTGTLTMGKPQLDNKPAQHHLQMAASLAVHSAHPLPSALQEAYSGPLLHLENIQEVAGRGMQTTHQGHQIKLGSRIWCGDQNADPTEKPEVWLAIDGENPVVFQFTDHVREDAVEIIQKLKQSDLDPVILSGDRQTVARNIADQLHIDHVHAEKTPPEKFQILEDEKTKGHSLLMVGDGLNDAPALAAANISMAPGTAIDMTQNAADIVFMGKKLAPVYNTYETAKLSQKLVIQNFALAVIYNIIAIPLAFAGFVTPMVAALAMSGSSLLVIANSFRLKLKKWDKE